VAQTYMQVHDFSWLRVGAEHRSGSDCFYRLRIGVDCPSLGDGLLDYKDRGLGGDVLEDIGLLGNADVAAMQLIADDGLFPMA